MIDAISSALTLGLANNDKTLLMGQDIGVYGGVFKATEGLQTLFGKDRVRDTPLCESAVLGAALGLSGEGYSSVVEIQFSDFISSGFTQVVNNLAKIQYRWQQKASVVIRMPCGAGTGGGPFHSQSNEAWFLHCPGLKIVYPSNPFDAKGLLLSAIADPNPVLFFEHKALYRSATGPVPEHEYFIPLGKGKRVREGTSLSLISYGMGVAKALEIIEEENLDVDLIDLRSIQPWDKELVLNSVKKTGKVLILTEANLQGSVASEIAAWLAENAFAYLDAPIKRVGSLETPIPFNKQLEDQYLPYLRLREEIELLLRF